MKKIIHIVIGKANPERMNGINRAVHEIASHMLKAGQDIEVWGLTLTPDAETPKRDYPLHLFENGARSFVMNPLVAEAIEALPAGSILHFHGGFIPAFYRIAVFARKKGIAWVISPHGAYMPASMRRNGLAKRLYLTFFDRLMVRHAETVHALTDNEEEAVRRLYPQAGIRVIPNACHQAGRRSTQPKEIYSHTKPIFCFVGRLDSMHKGLDLLLTGFSQYRSSGGMGELWLVGDGKDGGALQKLAQQLGIAHAVRFWGERQGDEKDDILRNAQVFVHPSRWEGMPMAVLEAAAAGRPLLVSKAVGFTQQIRHWKAGIVLDENTPSAIATEMFTFQQLHKLGKLSEMGEKAKDMIENDFRWDKIVGTMLTDMYKAAS